MTPRSATPPPRPSLLARFGPLTAILVAIGLIAVLASTGRDDEVATDTTIEAGGTNDRLPIYWADAEADETTTGVDWGSKCDPDTGRVQVPSVYAPPCAVARPGIEGGATYQGVTADTVKVVLYQPADDDLSAVLQAQADSAEDRIANEEAMIQMLAARYETWGRTIETVILKGRGSDETNARADAVKVATEIGAFASIGSPGQESAYAEELASRGVLCVGCGLSVPDTTFQKFAPYLWGNLQTPEQYLLTMGDVVIGQLNGKPAIHAGDPAMHDKKRVFGAVNFEQDPPVFTGTANMVAERGKALGYESKVRITYQLVIAELAEKARSIITQLKKEGVTTVIFLGDPIMPIYLTQAATDQDYYPEWVITGTVLTDTTAMGRRYDQTQWAHAFGISSLPARLPLEQGESYRLHDWFYGTPPPGTKTAGLVYEPIRVFMLGVHMAGPDLTPETFRDGLFAYPPSGGTPTAPQISFGDHGYFDAPDFQAVDDMQLIWWDAEATGKDEQGIDGTGMMRFMDGGRRYLPGGAEGLDDRYFDEAGTVIGYPEEPPGEAPPQYPSPAPGN
ncbi:MAG: hypothetical protein ABI239_03325 [Aquihabitans sp.]